MRLPQKAKKKTAFVPRIIFQAATVVGAIPFCVAGCGGKTYEVPQDASTDGLIFTVAAECFDSGCRPPVGDVAIIAFDGGDVLQGVACVGFDGGPCGPPVGDVATIGFDGGDAPLGVALTGFDGGDGGDGGDAELGVAVMAFDAGTEEG
jgi:hypothetical protein